MTKRENLQTQRNLLESAIRNIRDSIALAKDFSSASVSVTLDLARTHLETRLTGIGIELDNLDDS